MASLRRPSAAISRPPPLPPSSKTNDSRRPAPSGDVNRRADARKSKVGDKIKKRMSMRYAAPVDFPSQVPSLPGQPAAANFLMNDPYQNVLPVDMPPADVEDDDVGDSNFGMFGSPEFAQSGFGQASGTGGVGAVRGEERIGRRGAADMTREEEWDLDELGKDGMDVQAFLKRTLTGADKDEVERFKAALQRSKQQNARELQRNVFKHYAEFVTISKEISTLENDMLELKELLGQWKDLPQLMGMEDTLAPTIDKSGNVERRRHQRNSMADLQHLYRQQLTTLWSTVEGSQKYLPLIPGRHLVHETHEFVELNAATYKAKQSVSMFLLNDLLLIAGRRRMKTAASAVGTGEKEKDRGRMVAERCWVLQDLVVVDVKDSGDLTNALKIRRGKEVCVYRTAKPEDKKALLGAFRQVSQELGEKKRKESEKEQERRKSMWHGDAGSASTTPAIPGLLSPGRPLSTIGLSVADTKDLRWIDEYGDDLTMSIATRDWEASVALVEKGNDLLKTVSSNPSAKTLLEARIEQLKPSLISQVTHDLSSPELRKSQAARLVALLIRLDLADLARDTFLKARRDVMMKRVRGIRCEGDTSIYVSELAIVCFTVIRHTSDWYMNAFKESKMASGFVSWAKEQIETFAELFRRQVYAPTIEDSVADECLRVVASHNRKLLRDVGLDFTFLLSPLLQSPSASASTSSSTANAAGTTHPAFQYPSLAAPTPLHAYHIEPSPFVPYIPDTPLEEGERSSSTAPLSINPKSPRKNRPSDVGREEAARERPASPAPPPRSARRGLAPRPDGMDRRELTPRPTDEGDSLR